MRHGSRRVHFTIIILTCTTFRIRTSVESLVAPSSHVVIEKTAFRKTAKSGRKIIKLCKKANLAGEWMNNRKKEEQVPDREPAGRFY